MVAMETMVFNQQKTVWKLILAIPLVMLLAGCQEEFIEITEPDSQSSFVASDSISDLILKVTLKDGSFDNMIDKCSETSISFPYTVRVKNEDVQINAREDLEALSQMQTQDKKSFRINYPVTVSFSDYSTAVLSSQGELQKIQNQYKHRIKDDDIESIDFIYPVEVNLYDTQFQKPESRWVGDDKELHGILKGKAGLIYEIGYPVALKKFDGTTLEVRDNKALEQAILSTIGDYDEDDEVEFDD